METALMIVSIILIGLVLLQSGKADGASDAFTGSTSSLFQERKERGAELFVSRLTMVMGILFFAISLTLSII